MEQGRSVKMLVMMMLILLAGAIFTSVQKAAAVTGPITGDVTWSGTVTLTGDITVKETGKLTILPGTVVKSKPNVDDQVGGINTSRIEIIVEAKGTLFAEGTSGSPILFTSSRTEPKQKGDWYGLRIQSDNVSLRYCTVEYGKEGIRIEKGLPIVEHSILQQNETDGVRLEISHHLTDLIVNANGVGISIADGINLILTNSTISDNNSSDGGGITLSNGTLTVDNCQIINNKGGRAGINAWRGTVFVHDSIVSGNGWYGIYAANITIQGSVINSTTSGGWFPGHGIAVVTEYGGGQTSISDSTIKDNAGDGIGSYYYAGDNVTVTNSTISNNGGNGIGDALYATVSNTTITTNHGHGIANATAVTNTEVINNGGDGIYLASITDFTGNCIKGNRCGIEIASSEATITLPPGNDIVGNAEYELKNSGSAAIIADGEYWGEPTTTELKNGVDNLTKIYDSNDDPSVGQVVIRTWLNAPQNCGEPPVAAFAANPTSGQVPLEVKFTDQSTGSITSWAWDFGDGGTSTEQSPTHTFNVCRPEPYPVTLTVTGPEGSDVAIHNIVVACDKCGTCDFNDDGKVTFQDFKLWRQEGCMSSRDGFKTWLKNCKSK